MTMKLEVPKGLFSSLHYPFSWSNGFCSGRCKSGSLATNVMGRRSNMKKVANITLFGHIFKKNQHIHFSVHGHFSWSTFGLHLVKGPKALRMHLKKLNHGSVTMKCDHGKIPSNMGQLHDPWYKQPLSNPMEVGCDSILSGHIESINMWIIEFRMTIIFRIRNPISFKYIYFWYLFLEPHQTTQI